LYIHSEEELVVRDLLFAEKPDVVIQCIDANMLKQSLTLTADLLELRVPMVISLNAVDETSKKGVWIDANRLSRLLGVPVVESIAVSGMGTAMLQRAVAAARRGKPAVSYGDIIGSGIDKIRALMPSRVDFAEKIALLLLVGDDFVGAHLAAEYEDLDSDKVQTVVQETRRAFKGNLASAVNYKRNVWVDEVSGSVVKTQQVVPGQISKVFGQLSRHPVFGIPILIAILYAAFLLVVNVANVLAEWMNDLLWVPTEKFLTGILPSGFWHDFLIGDYGVISFGIANALLTVLPILSVFFLMYNAIEETGYIPNVSVMTRRILEKLGLSGAAIMPLVLAFGCKTMATMTTRTLHSPKEKYIAIYLIAFAIPCAAQIGLNMSILGRMGSAAFFIAFAVLAFVELAVGMFLNKIIKDDRKSDYIQYLPPIRLPNIKSVLLKTYYRLYWFLREAVPVFAIAAAALFVIDVIGLLDAAKIVLSPIVKGFLGLPLDMVDALLLCMARHEAAAALIINLIDEGQLNWVQAIVAVTLTTMFVPCFANVVSMIKELGLKRAGPMIVAINGSAFVVAGALNWVMVSVVALG
jgi:ferrous iron transport protein B